MASFDIVCEVNMQEVTNGVDQAMREIGNRYDFRGSNSEISLDKERPSILITADDEFKMQTTIDILLTKLIKRSVPVNSLIYGKTEPSGKMLKKEITIQQGLSKEHCKKINLYIKSTKLKVQTQVHSDTVRVSGKKKDDLQTLMKNIKDQSFDFDINFTNFR